MADSGGTAATAPPSKGFGRILQRSVTRTKEKVLQNLGKADRTRDDDFEQHVQNFHDQQAVVEKLQKELRHYSACVKEMSVASYNMYRTIKETYEINWTGYTEVTSGVEQMSTLWEDYLTKLNDQVTNPLTNYINSFQEIKKQIAKRGRKLTDYDSARHNHESLCTAKRHDEAKITKALDELNEARQVYEGINVRLHDELPSFHAGRVGFVATLFNALFTTEAVFLHETAKLKDVMSEVTQKLSEESNHDNSSFMSRKFGSSINRSDSDVEDQKLDNHKRRSVSVDQGEPQVSRKNSGPVPTSRPVASPRTAGPNHLPRHSSINSPSTKTNCSPEASQTRWFSSYNDDSPTTQKTAEEEKDKPPTVSSQDATNTNGHYAIPRPLDDIYKVPSSNKPVSSLYPNEEILYKVVATHSYVGDDTDELSFEPGELIGVVAFEDPDDQDEGWLTGIKELSGEKGVFPENFTKRLVE